MGRARGLLKDDTTYIHCTMLSDEEIRMIVDTGGTVSLAFPVKMMMGHEPRQRLPYQRPHWCSGLGDGYRQCGLGLCGCQGNEAKRSIIRGRSEPDPENGLRVP